MFPRWFRPCGWLIIIAFNILSWHFTQVNVKDLHANEGGDAERIICAFAPHIITAQAVPHQHQTHLRKSGLQLSSDLTPAYTINIKTSLNSIYKSHSHFNMDRQNILWQEKCHIKQQCFHFSYNLSFICFSCILQS